ncbi:MAG TPA: ABC transporter substrate-binding protein [Oscillospiraceae bacterium]|nr:ABC transporter substrate-binding protein [Oscillospiraceae bacterium]
MKKIFSVAAAFIFIIFSVLGCAKSTENTSSIEQQVQFIEFNDSLGHSVKIYGKRAAAASGSFAQAWILAGGELAGTTSDAFENIEEIPSNVKNIGNLHSPNLEAITALNPDFVILSADISGHSNLYSKLKELKIPAALFSVETFDDYLNMLKIFTDITQRKDLYEKNGLSIKEKIDEIISNTKGKPSPKILLLRASSEKVSARSSKSMAGAMLKDMGCINIADEENSLLEELSIEKIIAKNPDFIFTIAMGNEDDAQKALNDALFSNPAFAGLEAVKNNRCIILPKELFHQKPNNRWDKAYEKLWEILYENT